MNAPKFAPQFVSHPLLKEGVVERREYQTAIAEAAKKESLMLVLPTGLGKTTVALLVLVERLERQANGKILFLAPTRPLVEQHSAFLKAVLRLDGSLIQTFTGTVAPAKREEQWRSASVVVSTPQIIENDLLSGRIDLGGVALLIFDECHRAVGNYSYVYIAEKYAEQTAEQGREPLVLGMTASPGSDKKKILEICTALGISRVESRTEHDRDVAPYIFRKELEWRSVEVPAEMQRQKRVLEEVLEERVRRLQKLGFLLRKKSGRVGREISKTELLELRRKIETQLARQRQPSLYQALSLQAEVLKIKHAVELVETQGIFALRRYFDRLRAEAVSKQGSKAAKRLLKDHKFVEAVFAAASYEGEHPKLGVLLDILRNEVRANPETRIIVFTNYRDTAEMVFSALQGRGLQGRGLQEQGSEKEGIRAVKFIGQASKPEDKGLKQREQVEIIKKFKDGVFNVLVATSVAEEGLDIPATDLVLFYEPIPSAIRSIQRKGRTARKKIGRVVVLIAKGTRDEAYYWVSRNKEREMRKRINEMRNGATPTVEEAREERSEQQRKITDLKNDDEAAEQKVTVVVDSRETKSGVPRFLEKAGAVLELQNLGVGDYVVSEKVCIERKTTADFLDSLVNGRRNLLEQVRRLRSEYEKPLLVLEGRGSVYGQGQEGQRRVHPNAVRGVLAAIALDFSVPVLQTRDELDTASLIYLIAKREQQPNANGTKTEVNPHGKKPSASLKEQQEFLVSALSNVGVVTARNLLRRFKTVERLVTASEEELREVERVGKKTAERLKEVLCSEYEELVG